MFRTVPLSIIRCFSLYTQQWYMSYRFADSLRTGSGPNWSGSAAAAEPNRFCQQTCMTYYSRTKPFHSLSCSQAVSKPVWHTVAEPNQFCQQICITYCSRTKPVPSWSCSQAVSKPVWHITLLCVQWKTPDDGQRNCPKYVEFYSKSKFEELVHVVSFIIRIYHDARWPEVQIRYELLCCMYIQVALLSPIYVPVPETQNKKEGNIYIYITILNGCETWSLILREERKLRLFENMVFRRIFGPRRD